MQRLLIMLRRLPAPVYYVLVAVLLPGGMLVVAALWLARRNRKEIEDAALAQSLSRTRFNVDAAGAAGLRPGAGA
jgi:hypothetical protein